MTKIKVVEIDRGIADNGIFNIVLQQKLLKGIIVERAGKILTL